MTGAVIELSLRVRTPFITGRRYATPALRPISSKSVSSVTHSFVAHRETQPLPRVTVFWGGGIAVSYCSQSVPDSNAMSNYVRQLFIPD